MAYFFQHCFLYLPICVDVKMQFNYWNWNIPALEVKLYKQKEEYIYF